MLCLSACQTLTPAPGVPWPERRAALQAVGDYGFSGRLAAATSTEGFSASVDWQQRGADSDLLLRAQRPEVTARQVVGGDDLPLRLRKAADQRHDAGVRERGKQLRLAAQPGARRRAGRDLDHHACAAAGGVVGKPGLGRVALAERSHQHEPSGQPVSPVETRHGLRQVWSLAGGSAVVAAGGPAVEAASAALGGPDAMPVSSW
jgi:hypothetical protein